jgi:tRNA(Arg) A34 adenosine deaminase TadA
MNKFMQVAIDEALNGMKKNDGGPFGAVIVKDNKIISKAHNLVIKTNDPTAHAEINAIRKASKKLNSFNLSGCELYTTCEPCPMCLGAIFWARIDKVYFSSTKIDAQNAGFDDNKFYNLLNNTNSILQYLEQTEAKELFDIWLKKDDKVNY